MVDVDADAECSYTEPESDLTPDPETLLIDIIQPTVCPWGRQSAFLFMRQVIIKKDLPQDPSHAQA